MSQFLFIFDCYLIEVICYGKALGWKNWCHQKIVGIFEKNESTTKAKLWKIKLKNVAIKVT